MGGRVTPLQQKRNHLRLRYGLEYDDYLRMFEEQDHKCSICGKISGETKGTRLFVDHCHTTGKVRELLCAGCNTLVGALENPLRKKAEAYLARLELLLREREGIKADPTTSA